MPGRKHIPLEQMPPPNVAALTDAQREIVLMLAEGLEPKEIAAARGSAHVTVKNHLWQAKERSGARTTCQLVAMVVADDLAKESEARGVVCAAVPDCRSNGGGVPVSGRR